MSNTPPNPNMIQKSIYSVQDACVGSFHPPFLASTDNEANRIFGEVVRDPSTQLHRHPRDFFLYRLGHIDLISGTIVADDVPVRIAAAMSHTGKSEEQLTLVKE